MSAFLLNEYINLSLFAMTAADREDRQRHNTIKQRSKIRDQRKKRTIQFTKSTI